jgi:DNA-binding transcriptional LysR family regulator
MLHERRGLAVHAEKLVVLRELLAAGAFRKAAIALGVTPSAVSQSVSALEGALGRPLVVRSRVRVTATPYGEQLVREIGPALDILERASRAPASALARRVKLRLGAYESIAVNALPGLLARLGVRHPNVTVAVRTGRSGLLSKLVRRGALDAALVVENELVKGLDAVEIATDQLGLYASPLAVAVHPRGAAYAGLAAGDDPLPRYYGAFLRAHGLSSRPSIECDSFEALRVIAARQVAAAVLPRRVALRTRGDLVELPLPKAAPAEAGRHAMLLVQRRGSDRAIRDLLVSELRTVLAT